MVEASIPVDLFNPGQVFACLGFLEAADVLLGEAEGGFDWSNGGDWRFFLRAAGRENPVAGVIAFLQMAGVEWLSPDDSLQERDGGTTRVEHGVSASSDPKAPDLPGRLIGGEHRIEFGYWADGSSRFHTTFKKSTNGASSHIRLQNALNAIKQMDARQAAAQPFAQAASTDSLFRLDPRGSVDPIHAGFSPDKLRKGRIPMRVATYPLCEVLAVIGLEHGRPSKDGPERFRFHIWTSCIPPELARVAMGSGLPFLATRCFAVAPQEVKRGGDRKMNEVTEEAKG